MKYSLKLRGRRALTRAEAKGCLAANIALPGAGSLAAGRAVGYAQMTAAFAGFAITILAGIPMIRWCLANMNSPSDPGEFLANLMHEAFWPVVGIGLFGFSMLWSIITGLQLVSQAKDDGVPPRIEPV